MKNVGWWIGLLILMTGLKQSFAQGDLMIYPRRLVFDSNQRSIDVTLANSGADSSSYSLSWKNYRMTESGQFTEISEGDSGQYFADPELRFYPREITLAPGESQKIRVQRVNNRSLPPGEYRSHLEFRSIKPLQAKEASSTEEQEGIQTKLNMHLAITIPVIMEMGNINSEVTLKNAELITSNGNSHHFQFDILRTGNKSSYGDFVLSHIDRDGKQTEVGLVRGVAVYTPVDLRHYSISLNIPEGLLLNSGTLFLEYVSQSKKGEILASLELPLGQIQSNLEK